MCGRFTLASDTETMSQTFLDFAMPMNLSPRYNVLTHTRRGCYSKYTD